ncbi:hypothetical protein C8R45DRAFT_313027 [Mycena sanguinolenta]|nr:hypothetical protein C8R45DRAFT_313027 [Mycena sanguinolenta]
MVNVVHDVELKDAADIIAKKTTEVALNSLLFMSIVDSGKISELTVERAVGAAINGIFYSVGEVHVISGQKLDLPPILRPSKGFAHPDIGALRAGPENSIQPAVIIAEGKVNERSLDDRPWHPNDRQPTALAKMAAAVHGTLILLVITHFRNPQNHLSLENLDSNPTLPIFTETAMAYGIDYDKAHVRVYIHFPQVETASPSDFIRFLLRDTA